MNSCSRTFEDVQRPQQLPYSQQHEYLGYWRYPVADNNIPVLRMIQCRSIPNHQHEFSPSASTLNPSKKFGRFVSTGNDSERRHVIQSTPDDWDRRSGWPHRLLVDSCPYETMKTFVKSQSDRLDTRPSHINCNSMALLLQLPPLPPAPPSYSPPPDGVQGEFN